MTVINDNSSIDTSAANIWRSWRAFRLGKKPSLAIRAFETNLEDNLLRLSYDLSIGTYRHEVYAHKIINEKKRRDIFVASVRDRVVHRLLYDYLVPLFDRRFDYDVWSCRTSKGLHAALKRVSYLKKKHPGAYIWRADIKKFFDHVDHAVLRDCLRSVVIDTTALKICDETIDSFAMSPGTGIPIGNLTSQLFANIYLHEFDRYVRKNIKPLAYLRYGDDFLLFFESLEQAKAAQEAGTAYLQNALNLKVNPRQDLLLPPKKAFVFLGQKIYKGGGFKKC